MEYRTQKGYSLVKTATVDSLSKAKLVGEHLVANGFTIRTLKEFIQMIEMYELVDAPILNDTDYALNIPISVEGLPKTMLELNDALKKYGLGLVEKQFTTDFLILYDEAESSVSASNN
jgi:hypothetical protein